jgi:exodeoxyribonuclease VII small subunit
MSKVRVSSPASTPDDQDATTAALPASYESAMAELDALVRSMESAELPLDQLLSGYQRGAVLLEFCREKLQAVEAQIKVLDDGSLKVWKPQ